MERKQAGRGEFNVSMQDPIADMLTRIRNGQMARHKEVSFPMSNIKVAILNVLKDEGYISDFMNIDKDGHPNIRVQLKYIDGKSVIEKVKRISKPGLRIYKASNELNSVPGFGIAILTTSKGVMSDSKARSLNIGGEVLCEVA